MLGSINPDRGENQHQQQLGVSDGASHGNKYPFIEEFSELLADLSMQDLENLLSTPQKNLAKALWEAENYGGSIEKAKTRLAETHGPQWHKTIKFKEHFSLLRQYYELVLILEHQKQWDDHRKVAKLHQDNVLE